MLTEKEKFFFASIAWGASRLSQCPDREGALLVRERKILSYGYNRRLIENKDWEISAVQDALYGSHDQDLSGTILFCTSFPKIESMKLIIAAGIKNVYFFGNPTDQESIKLMKSLSETGSNYLELIKLEIDQPK